MPIRTRTTTDFFEKEKAKEDYSAPPAQPVSLGSATKPVNWKRAQRPHRAPLERPIHSIERKKPVAPVVDGSNSFLGVFLPRPSVNLTRSSFSDVRAKDVKATEDFKRPATSKSQHGGTQVSGRASDLFEDGLAPDFEPIELVSVALLFPKTSPTHTPTRQTTRDGSSTPTPVPAPALPPTPTRARVPASQFDDDASVVTATDVSASLAPPPTTPSKRKSSGLGLRIPSRLSFRSVSESRAETPLSPLPSLPSSRQGDAADDDLDTELLPPQPSFLRDSGSPRKRNRASSVGGDTTASGRPSSALSSRFHRPPPPPPVAAAEAFVPKMATMLTRFSSRQMGDHKCKRGYPIAVFCGAQSMDVGSITNPKIEGAYTLFFGPGHPANVQQAMTDSERVPSHLHHPKPATTSSTARRAELIAATRALQAIHDLYQGKACAHVCMDSPYVAKAWGSWIPQWEEDGWPGDEHISKRKKDSGYQGSGDFSGSEEVPRKRSSKRLADEDLLRELAAIRRLYARAERKGTGAAHLYLIDRNSNPASKTARVVLDNCKVQEFASPTQSATESRRDSFMSSRPSMTIDALGAGRSSRLSMSGSRRSATRESLSYDEDGRGSRRSNSRASNARPRTLSHRPAPPVPVQEEAESELPDDGDVVMVAAPTAKAPRKISKKKVAAVAAAPTAVVAAATQRPESIKSAASAVTALSENEDEVVAVAAKPTAAAVEPVAVAKAAPALAMPIAPAAKPTTEAKVVKAATPPATADESDEGVVKPDGLLASAAATAAAFVAGMTGSRTPEAKEPEAAVPEEPEAAVPEEAPVTTVDLDGPTATDPVEAAVVDVKDPGAAVPEEPEIVLAPAAVISTSKKTPSKKTKAAATPVVAATDDVVTPTKTKSVKKSTSARKPKLANAVVDPLPPSSSSPTRGSPTRASPTRAKSVEPLPPSPVAPKTTLASPGPTPDKSGRLINYSKRNSMMKAKQEAEGTAATATVPVGSALKSTTEEAEPVSLVDDAAEESEAAVPAATTTKVVPLAAVSSAESESVAEPTIPAGYPKPLAAARSTTNGKTVKKQQSMPATRASRDLSSGGDRVSLKSSTSSVGRRFRTLSTSFGRSGNRAGLGASPEEEEAVNAAAADKKAKRKTMKWFKKGEDVPPVPVVPVAAAPAAAAEEESEVAATESVVPEEEESEVAAAPAAAAPRTNGSAALLRPGHRRQPTEQSVFEDDEDEEVAATPVGKANGSPLVATTTPASPSKGSRLSRMSMSRSSAPKSPKTIKTPKPAKEPKVKTPKQPKEPREPFSFKRSMGKILTME